MILLALEAPTIPAWYADKNAVALYSPRLNVHKQYILWGLKCLNRTYCGLLGGAGDQGIGSDYQAP